MIGSFLSNNYLTICQHRLVGKYKDRRGEGGMTADFPGLCAASLRGSMHPNKYCKGNLRKNGKYWFLVDNK